MNKKSLFATLLAGFSAVTMACTDDAGNKTKDSTDTLSYSLSCLSGCDLQLEPGMTSLTTIQLKSRNQNNQEGMVANAMVHATTASDAFTMQLNAKNNVDLTTDSQGIVILAVQAGNDEASDKITFSIADEFGATPIDVPVTIKKKAEPVDPEPPKDVNVSYKIALTYDGDKNIQSAEVALFAGKSCADVATTGMTPAEIKDIALSQLKEAKIIDESLDDVQFNFTTTENEVVTYAAFARATENGKYIAYGCTDNVSQNNTNAIISLDDAYIDVLDPDNPDNPDTPNPDIPDNPDSYKFDYSGNFYLRSSFDALSLLPRAEVESGKTLMFKDMLAGDWIKFSLDLLSNPEEELPKVVINQLLPLLVDSDWLQNLLDKAGLPISSDVVITLIQTLKLDQYVSDLLKSLTVQLPWWDDATSVVKIVDNLATNFTMEGQLNIASAKQPNANGTISGIGHSYSTLLYSNGSFPTCIIGDLAEDVVTSSANEIICRIKMSDLGTSTIRGAFTAEFQNPATLTPSGLNGYESADIHNHNLDLAYGKLIYNILMESLPKYIHTPDGVKLQSMGDILAYFVGMGLSSLWNKDENHADSLITSSGCNAVGEYVYNLIGTVEALEFLKTFTQPTVIAGLCTTGTKALDSYINKQLDTNLSVSGERMTFHADKCQISYDTVEEQKKVYLVNFGRDQVWGSSTQDGRCTWDLSITTGSGDNVKTSKAKGKFWAERI